jgi:hypothetical protein
VAFKYRDDVVTIVREVVGLGFYPHNHVWFETPDGYAYSSWVQPVQYAPAAPAAVPVEGVYGEVCVPYTDARNAPNPQAPILYRLYYPTTYQLAARVVAADGSFWYRLHDENVVTMYAQAGHIRLIDPDEFAPLSPGAPDKSIVVSLKDQRLTALEGAREVFRATIASGRNFFGPDGTTAGSLTPAGEHPLWQKRALRYMTDGTPTDGYNLPGVPWLCYFSGQWRSAATALTGIMILARPNRRAA